MVLNNKGQSIFEFVIFLPLMVALYMIVLNFGSAINGSINQQKIARAYFFSKAKGNSMLPRADDLVGKNWDSVGMFFIGWSEKLQGGAIGNPIAPCYKIKNLVAPTAIESCEHAYTGDSTQYIRVRTVFGLCTTTYQSRGGAFWGQNPLMAAKVNGCEIIGM